ncbi:PQQ-binding-like beta-propeller repeat protein [Streptomyces sp. P38-E01]|uniref:PQQ-binding-like beta-propeller repeat protein n=1 Tax=Streptomyces tardus TaxID=2780544 RepID=A0A949JH42_9ACTN|nr:PQQ-binding-like beta-propeller repeat protein [Streptomyces tardus]MBU7598500.1 PQQ-binding-like beta-propeller repeat protein [Streptomyces tardus]
MSQPPPPPNQPPSGGFGGPQDPSYGYPQTPPPGQPTGPNPYAGGQGPYGQQPTAPMQQAPGGQQPGNNNKKILMVCAAVVAVAVIAVGTVFVVTKDDGEPEAGKPGQSEPKGGDPDAKQDEPPSTVPKQDSDAEIAWEAPVPKGFEGELSKQAHGVLFSGGSIVKYEPDGLVAYNIKTGKPDWKEKFIRGESCSMASTSSGGKTLVQWGAKCEKVMGFDITKGKKLWEKDLPSRETSDLPNADYAHLAVSGDLAGMSWTGGRVGYRLSDGKELWSSTEAGCSDQGYAGGENFIVLHQCLLGTDGKLRKFDQKGEKTAEWKVPKGVEVKRVFSTSPLVVGLSPQGLSSKLNNIAVLDEETLKLKKRIKIDPERYRITCQPSHALDSCLNAVVDKDSGMIMLETETYDGKERTTNAVSGFNLETGKMVWTAEPSVEGRTNPVGMHDGKLLTLEQGNYDGGGGVTSLDPKKGGTPKQILEFSADEREKARDTYSNALYWADNTLFLVNTRLPSRIDDRTTWLVAIR